MEQHIVKILSVQNVTHDVRAYRIEKPSGYRFGPGQATDVSINKEGWREEKRPFTFTSLNEYPYLEFTIKSYHDHPGVTNQLYQLKSGDELIIHDVWGAIFHSPSMSAARIKWWRTFRRRWRILELTRRPWCLRNRLLLLFCNPNSLEAFGPSFDGEVHNIAFIDLVCGLANMKKDL
jgi:hypothetical protein